ncbi:hypothetical protein BXZ70DRAFT_1007442 [Cristinia sonorae]|uniref:Uncharacterized protein n=1 Tax=Cristinia sonorae TaxID=1940300 RepID=A0A8K0UPM9_9AGAR|nr:hypothetical protein BXZ70DRAFT_1007442 [Cristinia sonorae]
MSPEDALKLLEQYCSIETNRKAKLARLQREFYSKPECVKRLLYVIHQQEGLAETAAEHLRDHINGAHWGQGWEDRYN